MSHDDARATVHYAGDDLFVAVTPSNHAQTLETNHERSRAATPMELLLVALGSCTAVDVISILHKKRERVTDYRVEVRGERRAEHPRKYTRFEVRHIVRGQVEVLVAELPYVTLLLRVRGNTETERWALERRRAFDAQIAALVREAVEAGEVRTVDPALAARLLSGMVNSVAEWARADRSGTLPDTVTAAAFDGILPAP